MMLNLFFMLLVGLVLALLMAVGALVLATRGPYSVVATVETDPDLPRITLPEVTLHGQVVGAEDAPLIIVLHGGPGGDHRSLSRLQALSDTYRVLVFDQRGAGLSQRMAPSALGVDDHLKDLDALIDRYSAGQQVILVGHSWGAMLAVAYLGHRPQAVSRAVLIEPGFLDQAGYTAWEARRQTLSRTPRVFLAGVLAGFRARNVTPIDQAAGHDFLIGSVVHAFANHPDNPYHCPGQPYDAPSWRFGGHTSDAFWADPAPAISAMALGLGHPAPILFMAGGCDTWIGEALQKTHAARFANGRQVTIADAGHDVVWDKPEATLEAIRAFLATPQV